MRLKVQSKKRSLLVILGSGGHTGEMVTMLSEIDLGKFTSISTLRARGDIGSIRLLETRVQLPANSKHYEIFRSRRVGQSYVTSVFTTLLSLCHALYLTILIRPQLILTNGPGTAVPVCYTAWGLSWLFGMRSDILYVESICRVKTLSWSGRLLYPIAGRFMVQWEALREKYPRAVFKGMLV